MLKKLVILFIIIISLIKIKNGELNSMDAAMTNFTKGLLPGLPDDTLLDSDHWRIMDEYLLRTNKEMEYNHCSYVDDILDKNYTSGYIDIVISPILTQSVDLSMCQTIRIIYKVPFKDGDKIILYKKYYEDNVLKSSVLTEIVLHSPDLDFIDTDVIYNVEDKYFVHYLRTDEQVVTESRYYHTKPSWMWCMRHSIRERLVTKLFFPGTHDSGSYIKPQWWQNILDISRIYFNYVYTQENTIFSQLMQGSRYLDLRLGKYNIKNETIFFVNHNPFKVHPLDEILNQIKEFLRVNPYEIIILDLHRFPVGFESLKDHDELAQYLIKQLNDLIYWHPLFPTWEVTIGDMWKTQGRIIIAYNQYATYVKYNFFPAIDQLWGQKDELQHLVTYMDEHIPRNCFDTSSSMKSAMTELTPTLLGIAANKYNGLRGLANLTNSIITHNFIGSWGNAVQAVAVDFISSTGIVTAAIIQNALRAQEGHICH